LINEAIDSLTDSDAFPSETGGKRAGLQHILKDHGKEFKEYHPQQLTELAEASTSIGLPMGVQGRNRPYLWIILLQRTIGCGCSGRRQWFCGVDEQEEF
jgi:hypothetical protein